MINAVVADMDTKQDIQQLRQETGMLVPIAIEIKSFIINGNDYYGPSTTLDRHLGKLYRGKCGKLQ